ncbi:MAG TPA: hypothetical protein VES38_01195 [Methylotenera sp.]|nr:hypothetical protein [Methylotenera sp.]
MALLFGLIAATANPTFIGLAAGLVLGLFLLAAPKKTIGLVIALGLGTPALLDMAEHGFSKALWAISMMALLLWIPGLLNLFDLNSSHKKHIPFFIWIAILFTLYAVITTVFKMHSIGELFGGFKRYFQVFGLMLALATLAITKKDFDQWLKLLLALALLQLPFALFERVILVPMRGGFAELGGAATDVVAGTMGANLTTGSPNSIMVIFVLIAFGFIFSRWKAGVIRTSRMLLLSLILLLPLVLGETKVVVLMLPLMGLVLLRKYIIQNPVKNLPMFFGIMVLTAVFAYIYVYGILESTFAETFAGFLRYNLGSAGYGDLLLNRTTVMSFWWGLHGWHDPVSFLFGHGLGSSYDAGHIAQRYPNYGINLTTVSTILWDLGLVGLVLYISIFITTWFQVSKVWQRTNNATVKADCLSIQVGIAFTLLFLLYSDSQVNLMVHEIIIAVLLGYAAFLYQQQRRESDAVLSQGY